MLISGEIFQVPVGTQINIQNYEVFGGCYEKDSNGKMGKKKSL